MRFIKPIIGLLLMAAAIGGLIFWETTGREEFMTLPVLVAAHDIRAGTIVTADVFDTVGFEESMLIEMPLRESDISSLVGKEAVCDIVKNSQITRSYFKEPGRVLEAGQSLYKIKEEWIDNRSSSLRKGDFVHIYSKDGSTYLGSYEVAFAKDAAEQEIIADEEEAYTAIESDPLKRTESTGYLDHIEIICTLEQYRNIRAEAEKEVEERSRDSYGDIGIYMQKLLLVQDKEKSNA